MLRVRVLMTRGLLSLFDGTVDMTALSNLLSLSCSLHPSDRCEVVTRVLPFAVREGMERFPLWFRTTPEDPPCQAITSGRGGCHLFSFMHRTLFEDTNQVWWETELPRLVGEVEEEGATQPLALDDDPVAVLDQIRGGRWGPFRGR
jgi:hypothetical protein